MTSAEPGRLPDWEAFYRDYRKPGYVPGFEITSKLGGGMFGLVFRARRMSIGKDYAIKFLQVEDESVRKAVLAELEQVHWFAQIDHPNLVSIEDRGEVDGIPYLVMAFAGTETLRDRMPAGRPPTAAEKDELLRCFLQCCRGLAALHERSLVHFDVKPANVFLKGGVARLGDYGLSKLVTHSRGSLSMGRGTPYYMAPELLQRRGDHRSDVYSLGVLLYELLCGKVPFTGDSEWEVLRKHETAAPELPSHLTPRERAVLQRCLQKDPAARFPSVHDLIAAFGRDAALHDLATDLAGGRNAPSLAAAERAAPSAANRAAAAAAPTRGDALAADLRGAALPECVPPLPPSRPLPPARAAAPRPLVRRAKMLAFGLVLVSVGFTTMVVVANQRRGTSFGRNQVAAASAGPSRVPAGTRGRGASAGADAGDQVAAQVEALVAAIQRNVRTAVQRTKRPALPTFAPERFAVPRDFPLYREQVQAVAKARVYPTGQVAKLERHGRPLFVAALAELLELDYDDADDCQRAANLHRLLGQLSAIPGLECRPSGKDDCETDACRFTAVADGWRRIADQFARTDAAYQSLLLAQGKPSRAER